MPDLKLLQAEFNDVMQKSRALEIEAGANPKAEQRATMMAYRDRLLQVQAFIDEENFQGYRKDMGELTDWVERPSGWKPVAINDDDDGRRELMSKGWEIRNGMVHVPTSRGELLPLYGEEVLFGPLPPQNHPEAHKYYSQARAICQPIYRRAYEKFMRSAVNYRSESMAMTQLTVEEQRALSEGIDTSGGYLVPPDLQAELLQRTAQRSIMRGLARIVNTSRDRVVFPRIEANSISGSIYSSGFVGGWAGETPAFTDTDPTFGTFEISVKKARVVTRLSNDFIADEMTNVLAWLVQNGAENLALVEDNGFINGDGTALQPLGILNDSGVTPTANNVEGTTSNTISNSSTDLGSATKMITLAYSLPSQYAQGAVWLMRRAVEGKVRILTDFQGHYMWPAMTGSAFAAVPRELLGYPIYNSDFMPNDGTDANRVMIFGDISNYMVVQRAQMSTVVLRERFADTDQTGIVIFERVGGGLWNPDAVRVGAV